MKQFGHRNSVWLIFNVALLVSVINSAMPDSGPSMETLYENGLILYHESVLNEEERLSACKDDNDCHPLSNFCCRFTNADIGYDKKFCLNPVAPKFSG